MSVTILPFIQKIMIRYFMSIYLVLGLIGNLFNLIVFHYQSRNRMSCSIYLIALSIFALIYLLWSVVPLLYTLDHIDPQIQSMFYCKIRLYGSHVLGQYVRFSVVFACIDRYFLTQTSTRLRAWSSVRIAKRLIAFNCILWLIFGSHLPIFMTIRDGVCWIFDFYRFFYPIYQTILVGLLPPSLMSMFGYFTMQTLYQRRTLHVIPKRRDGDLMKMLIAEVIINIFTSITFSANLLYNTATVYVMNKSQTRIEIENFVNFLSQFLIHLLSVLPFYLFMLASKSFRRDFKYIMKTFWLKYIRRRNYIFPIGQTTTTPTRPEI